MSEGKCPQEYTEDEVEELRREWPTDAVFAFDDVWQAEIAADKALHDRQGPRDNHPE